MTQKFHQRFNIQIPIEEAQRRFVNRAHNHMESLFNRLGLSSNRFDRESAVCSKLGIRYVYMKPLHVLVGEDFEQNLHALESLYLQDDLGPWADKVVKEILNDSEVDLGIRWEKGQFIRNDAPLLDEKAVNDVLGLTNTPEYRGVDQAFRKGLTLFLDASKKPDFLSGVVTHMYEALEALAKIICGNDKDLSANREALVTKLKLIDPFKQMLKPYIEYANDLHRHAGEKGQAKPLPSHREVEAFMYLTGLVIRLALSKET